MSYLYKNFEKEQGCLLFFFIISLKFNDKKNLRYLFIYNG